MLGYLEVYRDWIDRSNVIWQCG